MYGTFRLCFCPTPNTGVLVAGVGQPGGLDPSQWALQLEDVDGMGLAIVRFYSGSRALRVSHNRFDWLEICAITFLVRLEVAVLALQVAE